MVWAVETVFNYFMSQPSYRTYKVPLRDVDRRVMQVPSERLRTSD